VSTRASVDHTLCSSVGMCLQMAPESFVLNEQRMSTFVTDVEHDPEALAEAAEACPMSAITLTTDAEDA